MFLMAWYFYLVLPFIWLANYVVRGRYGWAWLLLLSYALYSGPSLRLRLGLLMLEGQELGLIFQNFENQRRLRAERIVALARRNGNNKREFSPTGAWIRDRMLKLLIPITSRGMDWMYAYNPCSPKLPPETSSRRYRQAA